jgi:hypothetical protein
MGVGVVRAGETFAVTQNFSKQSICVVQSLLVPSGAGLELVLAGRVREGSGDLAVFVNGVLHSSFRAGANGEFETRVIAPLGSVVSLGQKKTEGSFSIGLLLPPFSARLMDPR